MSCETIDEKSRNERSAKQKPKGELLSEQHCTGCHQNVKPVMLDSISWADHVLPAMAKKMGIGVWQDNQYFSIKNNDSGNQISLKDWDLIVEYYSNHSLDQIPVEKQPVPEKNWSGFQLEEPVTKTREISTTTMVAIDSVNHRVYTSDESALLRLWNDHLTQTKTYQLPSQGVHMSFALNDKHEQYSTITCIGNIMATDESKGSIVQASPASMAGAKQTMTSLQNSLQTVSSQLKRPVFASAYDYDKDGRDEIIVCGFGHEDGALSVTRKDTAGKYSNHVLWERSGALQIENIDYNNDGWMDFVALFGQGDEGIWLFQNNQHGGFDSRNLLHFSPLNGSSSFQLYDFNNDGRMDILYTCGDNSDYSRVLKPFHGIYIYLNVDEIAGAAQIGSGAGTAGRDRAAAAMSTKFKQSFFYPLNGCTRAIAHDYDKDGKTEIAAISFFADLREQAPRSFLYFRQETGMHFKPYEIPVSGKGRWICMDANDIDGDGDIDIVLGNYAKGFINQDDAVKGWDKVMPFIVLKNLTNAQATE